MLSASLPAHVLVYFLLPFIDFMICNVRFHNIVIGFITLSSISCVIKMGWGGGAGCDGMRTWMSC